MKTKVMFRIQSKYSREVAIIKYREQPTAAPATSGQPHDPRDGERADWDALRELYRTSSLKASEATPMYGLITESLRQRDALAQALKDLTDEVKLGKLNIRKDFSLINAHTQACKALWLLKEGK